MHALVTGGAGFIGSHLARKLIGQGAMVTVVDNLSTGFESNIPQNCDFLNLDITEENFTENIPDTTTHIFHLAAQSSGEISFENPIYDLKTNTMATLNLLKWSLKHYIEKFIFTSSMNAYGNVPDEPISESYPNNPNSFYAVGKVASENYIKIFSDLGIESVVLRLFNVYGPGQNLENLKQGMLSIYCAYILKNESINIKGSLNRFRDFIYIDDVIDALLKTLNIQQKYDIFNICTGVRTTVEEAVKQIIVSFGMENYPYHETQGTPRDQFGIYGDPKKSKKLLDWQIKTDLAHGLAKTVEWIKS